MKQTHNNSDDSSDEEGLVMFSGSDIKKTMSHYVPAEGKGVKKDLTESEREQAQINAQ